MRLPKMPAFRVPRSSTSDAVDLAGLACLVGAAWWWLPVVGLVATGLALLLIGWVVGE
jgi:hypothetical protein